MNCVLLVMFARFNIYPSGSNAIIIGPNQQFFSKIFLLYYLWCSQDLETIDAQSYILPFLYLNYIDANLSTLLLLWSYFSLSLFCLVEARQCGWPECKLSEDIDWLTMRPPLHHLAVESQHTSSMLLTSIPHTSSMLIINMLHSSMMLLPQTSSIILNLPQLLAMVALCSAGNFEDEVRFQRCLSCIFEVAIKSQTKIVFPNRVYISIIFLFLLTRPFFSCFSGGLVLPLGERRKDPFSSFL